jgi:hypothetical protein
MLTKDIKEAMRSAAELRVPFALVLSGFPEVNTAVGYLQEHGAHYDAQIDSARGLFRVVVKP